MASASETGHAVNIANFKVLIERCKELGSGYCPPNLLLSVGEMTSKLNNAEVLHRDYIAAVARTKIPINEREVMFAALERLVVRVCNLYLCTEASEASKRDAKAYMIRITGRYVRVPRLTDGVTPAPNYKSNSQKSFVQRTSNFEMLVNLCKVEELYTPNEPGLQVASLEDWVDKLKAATKKVDAAVAEAMIRRVARDHALYDAGVGVIDLASACKMYVKGVFGGLSPEAMSVVSIKFRRIMRMNAV